MHYHATMTNRCTTRNQQQTINSPLILPALQRPEVISLQCRLLDSQARNSAPTFSQPLISGSLPFEYCLYAVWIRQLSPEKYTYILPHTRPSPAHAYNPCPAAMSDGGNRQIHTLPPTTFQFTVLSFPVYYLGALLIAETFVGTCSSDSDRPVKTIGKISAR